MRKPYNSEEQCLLEENLSSLNPFVLFHEWFEKAKQFSNTKETNAVCLATCSK